MNRFQAWMGNLFAIPSWSLARMVGMAFVGIVPECVRKMSLGEWSRKRGSRIMMDDAALWLIILVILVRTISLMVNP